MDNDEIRDWFLALTDPQKQIFLALVSNRLTLDGRYLGHYVSGEQQIRGFIGLNELQHQISGHITGLGLGRDRYSDDVFWKILEEKAVAYGFTSHLRTAFEFARTRELWNRL